VPLLHEFAHLLDQGTYRPEAARRLRLVKGEIELAR
jgi:hypothetical protein